MGPGAETIFFLRCAEHGVMSVVVVGVVGVVVVVAVVVFVEVVVVAKRGGATIPAPFPG